MSPVCGQASLVAKKGNWDEVLNCTFERNSRGQCSRNESWCTRVQRTRNNVVSESVAWPILLAHFRHVGNAVRGTSLLVRPLSFPSLLYRLTASFDNCSTILNIQAAPRMLILHRVPAPNGPAALFQRRHASSIFLEPFEFCESVLDLRISMEFQNLVNYAIDSLRFSIVNIR